VDQPVLKDLYDKINAIAINVATLTATSKEKEIRCEEHQKKVEYHDLRIRALELVASSAAGSSTTSHDWRDTLMRAFTLIVAVAATIIAMKAG
jgi:hypothetical protein